MRPDAEHFFSARHAGFGAALVPEGVTRLRLDNVVFRPVRLEPERPLEMYMLWRRQNDNPVLPRFLALCEDLGLPAA